MALPFFYEEQISTSSTVFTLNEDSSKHVVQVLRMKNGERLKLTNGIGDIFTCEIIDDHRKRCEIKIVDHSAVVALKKKIIIAISPLKNNSRYEWFLEKATEIGIHEIVPLICERTEKAQVKVERLKSILVSAMLQSQQAWLPILHNPTKIVNYIKTASDTTDLYKLIAHCEDGSKETLPSLQSFSNTCILIGPEGDFTRTEIDIAMEAGFQPVSLGDTRLRTETAGIVAAVLLTSNKP